MYYLSLLFPVSKCGEEVWGDTQDIYWVELPLLVTNHNLLTALQYLPLQSFGLKITYRLVRNFFTRDTYPGIITWVLFSEVCDTRVF